ncbi:Cysteine-rich RLK (RECEPTOR-like protein kinase) 8 [Gossypium australe]|uniref:Cysteine-rich RLK (RECEPTOR-like protein kinase) 8 n=1 Tax=Gossypium australe TaxID=47621 RepID=A0A5B6U8P4_9ROSI|nr:Cysteine-rich RLK (RECEPTOR-like protein kinase) 8 [Gossypium australe]
MSHKKTEIVSDIVLVVSKFTEHKLNGTNFLDWNHTIELYLLSISIDGKLTDDPPTDDSRLSWVREDTRLYIQIRNSIDSEVVGLVTHWSSIQRICSPSDSDGQQYKTSNNNKSMGLGSYNSDKNAEIRKQEQGEIVCHYYHKPSHIKRDCRKLQYQKAQCAHFASSSKTSEKSVTIPAEEYARLTQLQETVKQSSSYITALVESADGSISSDLMTKKIIDKGHESDGLYILDTQKPESIVCVGRITPFEEHCRLGPPSLSMLKKLCPQFSNITSLEC